MSWSLRVRSSCPRVLEDSDEAILGRIAVGGQSGFRECCVSGRGASARVRGGRDASLAWVRRERRRACVPSRLFGLVRDRSLNGIFSDIWTRRPPEHQNDFDRRCTSTTAIYVQRGRYGRLAETPRHDIASAARARRTMAEVQSSSRSQQAYAIGAA